MVAPGQRARDAGGRDARRPRLPARAEESGPAASSTTTSLFLLARLRDEAHRFSNRARMRIGKKRRFHSPLDDVKGLGPRGEEGPADAPGQRARHPGGRRRDAPRRPRRHGAARPGCCARRSRLEPPRPRRPRRARQRADARRRQRQKANANRVDAAVTRPLHAPGVLRMLPGGMRPAWTSQWTPVARAAVRGGCRHFGPQGRHGPW